MLGFVFTALGTVGSLAVTYVAADHILTRKYKIAYFVVFVAFAYAALLTLFTSDKYRKRVGMDALTIDLIATACYFVSTVVAFTQARKFVQTRENTMIDAFRQNAKAKGAYKAGPRPEKGKKEEPSSFCSDSGEWVVGKSCPNGLVLYEKWKTNGKKKELGFRVPYTTWKNYRDKRRMLFKMLIGAWCLFAVLLIMRTFGVGGMLFDIFSWDHTHEPVVYTVGALILAVVASYVIKNVLHETGSVVVTETTKLKDAVTNQAESVLEDGMAAAGYVAGNENSSESATSIKAMNNNISKIPGLQNAVEKMDFEEQKEDFEEDQKEPKQGFFEGLKNDFTHVISGTPVPKGNG